MALTGELLADFSSFNTAVSTAQVQLKGFDADATKVGNSLNKMGDSFSGKKITQDATLMAQIFQDLGGAEAFTTAELARMGAVGAEAVEKLKALGKDVPPGIQAIADQAKHASSSLKEFASDFDLKQAITEPIGGAREGLIAFVEELGPAGVALAAVATAGAATGAAVLALATDAGHVGAGLDDMADKTGLSVGELSKLSYASEVIGADMGALTNAVFKLQKGIGDNTAAFQAGLQKMGLSTEELRAAGPDRYLELVAAGLRSIDDTGERAAAGAAVLGRGYREVAHTLQDLDNGLAKTADLNPWTAEQARAAEEFEQQLGSIETHIHAAAIAIGNDLIPAVSKLVTWSVAGAGGLKDLAVQISQILGNTNVLTDAMTKYIATADTAAAVQDTMNQLWANAAARGLDLGAAAYDIATSMLDLGVDQKIVAEQTGLTADEVERLQTSINAAKNAANDYDALWGRVNAELAKGIPTIVGVSDATQGLVADMRAAGVSVKDMADASELSVGQIKLLEKAENEAAAAAKKLADELKAAADKVIKDYNTAWGTLAATGANVRETVASVNPVLRQQIEYYLRAGASIRDVAAAYPQVGEATVKAIDTVQKSTASMLEESSKGWADYAALIVAQTGTAYDAAAAKIDAWYQKDVETHQKAGTDNAAYYARVGAMADAQYAALATNLSLYDKDSRSYAEAEATRDELKYQQMLAHQTEYSAASLQKQKELADAARRHAIQFDQDEAAKALAGGKAAGDYATGWDGAFTEVERGVITWRTAMTEASAAIDAGLAQNVKNIQTLAGEFITASEAKRLFDSGGSATIPGLTAQQVSALGGRDAIEKLVALGRPQNPITNTP
jgi:uncharacterized protein (DUF433 family)